MGGPGRQIHSGKNERSVIHGRKFSDVHLYVKGPLLLAATGSSWPRAPFLSSPRKQSLVGLLLPVIDSFG